MSVTAAAPCQRCSAFLFEPAECACPDLRWFFNMRLETERNRIAYCQAVLRIHDLPKFRVALERAKTRAANMEELLKKTS